MRHPFLFLLAGLLVVGCDTTPTTPAVEEQLADLESASKSPFMGLSPAVQQDLAAVRRLTAPFHNLQKAQSAGYNAQITGCIDNPPVGAQGVHFADVNLIDGTAELLAPEILVYEPQPNGSFKLVSIEYIVPIPAWQGAQPPMLFGQQFPRNDALGLYALHVWLWRHNPDGLFADWNPKVSC